MASLPNETTKDKAKLGPKSRCYCGHTGDGHLGDHAGWNGHGQCLAIGCDCVQFTWKCWLDDAGKAAS
jgi:hypothetical protein